MSGYLVNPPRGHSHQVGVALDNIRFHRLTKAERVLGRKRSDLIREALDLLYEKYDIVNLEE